MQISFRAIARAFAFIAIFATAAQAQAHGFKVGNLEISHPWSRATVPGAKVAAGYLKIKNKGTEADRLVSVTTELTPKAEIHEMGVDAQGIMTMRPVGGGLEIPAGGEVELAPNGFHIMVMGLEKPLAEGAKFKATLTFEKAGTVDVEFAVEAMGSDHTNHNGG